jgi:hypothetical protein
MRRCREAAPQFSISLNIMKKILIIFILILGILSILSSCGPGQPVIQPGSPTQENEIHVIPTPSAGKATITGILKQVSGNGSDPVRNTVVSLGQVLENDQGTPVMGQLNSNTKLRSQTDTNGRFLFSDVPAGKYVLISDYLVRAYLLKDPKTGGDLIISATPNQVVDLGTLVYEKMP